jgi:hypothetical protein
MWDCDASSRQFTGAGASAAAMLPLSAVASGDAQAVQGGIVQVDHKSKNWQKKNWQRRKLSYCNDWNDRCNDKHRRRHFDRSDLYLPLIIGGGFGGYNYYDDDYGDYDGGGLSSRHVQWCLNRYQSYNPRYNTWVAYSGQVKKCYSPYM